MDLDTDAAFAGEANLDGKQNNKKTNSTGEANTLTARGGVDGDLASTEDSPLLPEQSNNGGTSQEWSASTDFDDKPWYKRPSVCGQHLLYSAGR